MVSGGNAGTFFILQFYEICGQLSNFQSQPLQKEWLVSLFFSVVLSAKREYLKHVEHQEKHEMY